MLYITPPSPPPIAVPVRPLGIPSGMRFLNLRGVLVDIPDGCESSDPNIRYNSDGFNALLGQFQIQVTDPPLPGLFTAYCLAAPLQAPPIGSPLRTADAYAILNTLTELQINRIIWVILNGYPAISAAQLFANAGVDAQAPPPLVDYDAFSATQLALWNIQTEQRLFTVQNCSSSTDHVKSPRIAAITQYLVDTSAVEGTTLPADPEISLEEGPASIVRTGDSVLVGPYFITSNRPEAITVSLSNPAAVIVNAQGIPVANVLPEERFFIRLPAALSLNPVCLSLAASLVGTSVTPIVFMALDASTNLPLPNTQQLGAVLLEPDAVLASDALQVCLPLCPPCFNCPPSQFIPCLPKCVCTPK